VAIFIAITSCSSIVNAFGLSVEDKQKMLSDTKTQHSAEKIAALALSNQSDQANFKLQRIKQPKQEVVRYLAVKEIAESSPQYTPDLAGFINSQTQVAPSLRIIEQGDGFKFSSLAFGYQTIGQRLLDSWSLNNQAMDFYVNVESKKLNLQVWLSEEPELTRQRETLLINNAEKLSDKGLQFLVNQITQKRVISWLPSSGVMVALARAAQSASLYDIVWKLKADSALKNEIERLGRDSSDFSLNQLMVACTNPSLSERSLQLLSKHATTSPIVEEFLISKMDNQESARVIAYSVSQYGYVTWLEELVRLHPKLTKAMN
jgi:hypothetical protein